MTSGARKLLAWLLDCIAAGILISPFLAAMFAAGDFSDGEFDIPVFYAFGIPGFIFVMAVEGYFQGVALRATPGKAVMGLQVVDHATHESIGFRRGVLAVFSMSLARAEVVER